LLNIYSNEWQSAASFCHQVAAWFSDMFCNFYLVKSPEITKSQQPIKLDKKHFRILAIFVVRLTKFKNNQILLNKISHRFLLTARLFTV
jgi:hypothetical protein